MAITLTAADVASLKTSAGFSGKDFAYLLIRLAKDPASNVQIINPASLAAYNITDDQLHSYLRSFSSGRTPVMSLAPANLELVWANIAETSALTQAQVLADFQAGVLGVRQLCYYAALLSKPAGVATQALNPSSFAGSPWNIPPADFVSNLYAIAGDDTPKFAVNVSQFSITWISPIPA